MICVARRTYTQRSEEIHSAWGEHVEQQYRRFPDWNLYFDKMRYLVFDLPPENYQSYPFDYLRLLSSLMLLAGQEIPGGCLRPGRLYRLECEKRRCRPDGASAAVRWKASGDRHPFGAEDRRRAGAAPPHQRL